MSDFVTCKSCGARSGSEAVWCSMCFEPLRSAEEPSTAMTTSAKAPDPSAGAAVEPDVVNSAAPPPATAPIAEPPADETGNARTEAPGDAEVDATTWQCRTCAAVNPISSDICSVCGTTIFQTMGADSDEITMSQNQGLTLALVPGLAHARLGEPVLGFIIGILVVACLAFALLFIQSGGVVWGLVVGLVGLLTWGVSVFDVNQRIAGAAPVLRPRVITILGGVVILIIMVAGFVAGASALRSS